MFLCAYVTIIKIYWLVFLQVKKFIIYFRNAINEGSTFEVLNLYENTFPKLSEQYFDKTPWPEESEVAPLVDNDPVSFSRSVRKSLLDLRAD